MPWRISRKPSANTGKRGGPKDEQTKNDDQFFHADIKASRSVCLGIIKMMKWFVFIAGIAVFLIFFSQALRSSSVQGYKGPASDHFDGERFKNLDPINLRPLRAAVKWRWMERHYPWPKWVESTAGDKPPGLVSGGVVRYTVINHATVLLQTDRLNILTDPIWSNRASPFFWIGPKRVRRPGISFDQLPKIDVVLVSHNHYDHMDIPTLLRLEKRDHPIILVGLGNADFLKKWKFQNVQELDWWSSVRVQETRFHFVPARHFSRRGLKDGMKTLWGGFMIQGPSATVYFAGDTGYGVHFKRIADAFPVIHLAFLPIGAYQPRWFMQPVHVDPQEAVQAHIDMKARKSVAMHFGTFHLADEAIDAPLYDLAAARQKAGLPVTAFQVPEFGRGYDLSK